MNRALRRTSSVARTVERAAISMPKMCSTPKKRSPGSFMARDALAKKALVNGLRKAYSEIGAFFQRKHAVDPENRFTSRFFELHGKLALAKKAASGE